MNTELGLSVPLAFPAANIEREIKLLNSPLRWALLAIMLPAWIFGPVLLGGGFALSLANHIGIAAIGAIGLNLLTGNTGQVSLGHPFFLGVGAYSAAVFGGDLGLPFPLWLVAAGLMGAAAGAAIGPFALRLRGHYLVIVTIALIFIGAHLFNNLGSITGGVAGRNVKVGLNILNFSVDQVGVFGMPASKDQGFFYLIWGLVAVFGLTIANILRSRPGRALQAVRERDMTAEVIGISLARMKISAFVISSALASIAGGLYGAYVGYVSPIEWNLVLGVQYLAMVIIGGIGSVWGSILGAAVIIGLPHLLRAFSHLLPFVSSSAGDGSLISAFAFNQILFGTLIVLLLLFEPGGLVAIVRRSVSWVQKKRLSKA
jgi:branched-chain amino acid transport system permease protein